MRAKPVNQLPATTAIVEPCLLGLAGKLDPADGVTQAAASEREFLLGNAVEGLKRRELMVALFADEAGDRQQAILVTHHRQRHRSGAADVFGSVVEGVVEFGLGRDGTELAQGVAGSDADAGVPVVERLEEMGRMFGGARLGKVLDGGSADGGVAVVEQSDDLAGVAVSSGGVADGGGGSGREGLAA